MRLARCYASPLPGILHLLNQAVDTGLKVCEVLHGILPSIVKSDLTLLGVLQLTLSHT